MLGLGASWEGICGLGGWDAGFDGGIRACSIVEEEAWAADNSYFAASIAGLFSIEDATDSLGLAIVDYNWNLEIFNVAKDLAVGSNLVGLVATVEGFAIGFGLLARAESSKHKSFDC